MLYFVSFDSPDITTYSNSTSDTSISISDLEPFTNYTFRVSAVTVAEGPSAEIDTATEESGNVL